MNLDIPAAVENAAVLADDPNSAVPVDSGPMYLHLSVTDQETIAALSEAADGRERQEIALVALRIGVLSLKAARGTVDGGAIRKECDRLLETLADRFSNHRELLDETMGGALRSYFDPNSGAFTERVARMLRHDGELATVITRQVELAQQSLDKLLTEHLGEDSSLRTLLSPEESNGFIVTMRSQVAQALQLQTDAIVSEFSLDRTDSALSRLMRELNDRHGDLEKNLGERVSSVVAEFSLDNKQSALSRLVGRVEEAHGQISAQFSLDNPDSGLTRIVQRIEHFEQAQSQKAHELELRVTALLEKLVTRRESARRSTVHGVEFQQEVGNQLEALSENSGDLLDLVGDTSGVIPRSKVGDFVVTLSPDSAAAGASLVIEAKASGGYTLKSTLDECDVARRNRASTVCLFVHSAATAPVNLPELHRWGHDVVVVWDETDSTTDARLKAAYLLARALCIRANHHSEEDAASFAEIDAAIEAIRKQIAGFEEIKTTARTIVTGGEKILNRSRIMEEEIGKRLSMLAAQLARVQGESAQAQA